MPTTIRIVTHVATLTEISDAEVGALALAVGRAVGHADEAPLISLLRKLEPTNEVLFRLDRIAEEHTRGGEMVDVEAPS